MMKGGDIANIHIQWIDIWIAIEYDCMAQWTIRKG